VPFTLEAGKGERNGCRAARATRAKYSFSVSPGSFSAPGRAASAVGTGTGTLGLLSEASAALEGAVASGAAAFDGSEAAAAAAAAAAESATGASSARAARALFLPFRFFFDGVALAGEGAGEAADKLGKSSLGAAALTGLDVRQPLRVPSAICLGQHTQRSE
jgi:hypothetical protein